MAHLYTRFSDSLIYVKLVNILLRFIEQYLLSFSRSIERYQEIGPHDLKLACRDDFFVNVSRFQ